MEVNITPINKSAAYIIHRLTDVKAGEILWHEPITSDGIRDPMRTDIFIGKTMMNTNQGPIELLFEINCKHLSEAWDLWTEALKFKLGEIKSAAVKQRILNGATGGPPSRVKRP